MNNFDDLLPYMVTQEAKLKRHPFNTQAFISPHLKVEKDFILDQLVATLTAYVWGDEEKVKVIRYPADWWQAFKERWMPEFVLRRWPVRYTVHRINAMMLYPDMKIQLPEEYHFLYWKHSETTEPNTWAD